MNDIHIKVCQKENDKKPHCQLDWTLTYRKISNDNSDSDSDGDGDSNDDNGSSDDDGNDNYNINYNDNDNNNDKIKDDKDDNDGDNAANAAYDDDDDDNDDDDDDDDDDDNNNNKDEDKDTRRWSRTSMELTPSFDIFQSHCVSFVPNTILLAPSFCRKNQFVSIRFIYSDNGTYISPKSVI